MAASASNNAALTGSYVPALVFGIPGDTVTAIVIGVLLMKGITPGPLVFINEAPLVYSLYLVFIIASLLMIPLGWLAVRGAGRVLSVPNGVLYPLILGPVVEENFMKSLIKADGDMLMFFERPLAQCLGAVTLAIWSVLMFGGTIKRFIRGARRPAAA